MLYKKNDLLHKRDDFIAVITDIRDNKYTPYYLAYYKNMPYTAPDNAISGMNGWYSEEFVAKWIVNADHVIFRQWGYPPEYKDARTQEIENELQSRLDAIIWAADPEHNSSDDPYADAKDLIRYVLGLRK